MKNNLFRPTFFLLALVAASIAVRGAGASSAVHNTYVLVHGAWGGGWAFKEVDRLLTADGHRVYRPTLTGLGEKIHLARPDINLTTHVSDIVNLILWEDLRDIVLVGHSYGGREYSRPALCVCWRQLPSTHAGKLAAAMALRGKFSKPPNKALEPTSTSVTPRAILPSFRNEASN